MGHFVLLWQELRSLLGKLAELPPHPYAPFYAPWDHMLQQRMELVRQQAAATRQIRTLGLQETWRGWAIPARYPGQSNKPLVGAATP